MKKGFTLAEVLITLAVIGVVAALTIPVLVQKYQKKQLYSQFMKTYNTLTNVMDNAVAEYGEVIDWNWGKWDYDEETGDDIRVGGDNPVDNYILSQMKTVKTCDDFDDCFASNYTYLDGEDGSSEEYPNESLTNDVSYFGEYGGKSIILADGTVMTISGEKYGIYFVVDTNGKKGPNVMGRDLFYFEYSTGAYEGHSPGFEIMEYDADERNCNPNSSGKENGSGCASRLLQEGKMNY